MQDGDPVTADERPQLADLFQQAPGFMAVLRGPDHVFEHANAAYRRLVGGRDVIGRPVRVALPDVDKQGFFELLDRVYATGEPYVGEAVPITLEGPDGTATLRHVDFLYQPIRSEAGAVIGIFVEGADVTDRLVAEASLRSSEERSRRIVEGVKDHAIFTTDLQGIVTGWTPGAEAIFRWPAEAILGQPCHLLFTPEDRAADVPAQELATARAQGCANDERWHVRRDGERFFANGSVRPLHDADGAITGFIKIARDDTARRGIEELLRESEERYRTLFENIDAGFCIIEMLFENDRAVDYRFVEINPAFAGQAGLHDAVGRTARELIPTLEQRWIDLYGQVALTGEPARVDEGSAAMGRWFDVHALRVGAPEQRRVAILFNDISDRRRAELALVEMNETLERRVADTLAERQVLAQVMEASDASITVIDLQGRVVAINRANLIEFERIYGIRPRPGDDLLDLLAHLPSARGQLADYWGRALAGEEFTLTTSFGDQDRERVVYEVRFQALRDRQGQLVGAFSTSTDQSERLRAQAELETAQEQLRQSQKMEAIGQLTGGVAHDFNNLLTVIRSSADLLRRPELPEDRRRRYIDAIADTADRAARLTAQLLAFARRQALRPETFNVAERVSGIADMLRTLLGSRIELAIDIACPDCFVEVDAGQFETALVNMVVNARDAMEGEGRLTVTVSAGDAVPAVRGHAGSQGRFAAISVTDTGTGIAPEHLERIFEPFFTTKDIGKGTGLGLSQLFGFAKQSGGEVDVASEAGRGTTFTLYLPRTDTPAAPVVTGEAMPSAGGRGCVLVVEDNVAVGEFATQLLTDLGYETMLASDAARALALLEERDGRFDLVFSDVVMPGMGGVELAGRVRDRYPTLPVVLTSGYSHVLAADARHGFALLHKPYSVEELSRVIGDAMARR